MNVNLKSLVGRLNDTCRNALEGGAGLCLSRTNYDVEIEHILAKLLEQDDTDLHKICNHYEVNIDRLSKDVQQALDRLKSGNSRTPGLSDRLPRWIQDAWLLASVDYGAARVRSGHMTLALLVNESLSRIAREISKEFNHISAESLQEKEPAKAFELIMAQFTREARRRVSRLYSGKLLKLSSYLVKGSVHFDRLRSEQGIQETCLRPRKPDAILLHGPELGEEPVFFHPLFGNDSKRSIVQPYRLFTVLERPQQLRN